MEEGKISHEDFNKFQDAMDQFEKEWAQTEIEMDFQYPFEVSSVEKVNGVGSLFNRTKVGSFVSIRPCDEEKTYLGIYLGDLPIGYNLFRRKDTKLLRIIQDTNPAIWVPDLNRIVWGCESWWGEIETPEELCKITDEDISNIWYVQALKALNGVEK
jgi:hypothetical protein